MNQFVSGREAGLGNIIFYGTPAYGHVNPTLPVISELVKRGYHVFYYATEEFQNVIKECGAKFRAYDFGEIQWTPQIGSHILELTELVLQFTNEQLNTLLLEAQELSPVLILHDTIAFWGRAVAGQLGIRAASMNPIITTYRYSDRAFRMYLSRFGWKSVSELKVIPDIMRYRKRLRKQYSIHKISFMDVLMNQEGLNIFTYPRLMHPDGTKGKANCFFLGPSAMLRKESKDNEEEEFGSPLIYVSLGTVFNQSFHFYRSVFAAFGNTKYQVVIACGGQYDMLMKEKIPTNIRLKTYVNQQRILKKAVLFISAGGMNSICEAAAYGVPCLLHPQQGEQDMNARAFERLGLGKMVRNEAKLLEEAEILLNDFKPDSDLIREFSSIPMEELIKELKQYMKKSV